jgi:hypothetical protein
MRTYKMKCSKCKKVQKVKQLKTYLGFRILCSVCDHEIYHHNIANFIKVEKKEVNSKDRI